MKFIRTISTVLLLFGLVQFNNISAQEKTNNNTWYFGIGGGYRFNHMSFSDIDKNYFPTNKYTGSGIFSVFVQGEFGKQKSYGVRPELTFLRRGGKLTEINKSIYGETIDDINYTMRADYLDIRVPLIYNFGKAVSVVRPYVFVAPVLGFTTGGKINLQQDNADKSYEGYELEASHANISSAYFAGQVGVGVKFAIPVADNKCYFGIEASYEYGFTDTYSKKEKDSKADDIAQLFSKNYKINGTRKFSGFEVQAVLSIPFSIFKAKKKPAPVEQPVEIPFVPEPAPEPEIEEKPCYTLEEIIDLLDEGEDVEGKTICAIDAVNFDFAQSTIKSESFEYLNKVASTIIRANMSIEVKGHTDDVGSDDFNMNLSKERAEAVMEYLISQGVSRDKIRYSYYGKTRPLTTNTTEEGRATNRRVEFTIIK